MTADTLSEAPARIRAGASTLGTIAGIADRKVYHRRGGSDWKSSRGRAQRSLKFSDFVNQAAHRNPIPGFDPVHQPAPI